MPTSSFRATFAGAMRAAGSDDEDTQALLIAGVRVGDRAAFEAIYRAYWPRLVAFARHYCARSTPDAEEIVQEIFLAIWRNHTRWDVRHGLTVYLFGAVRNRAHRVRRLRAPPFLQLMRTSVDNSGEHRPIVGELTATIETIVDDMPDRCRKVYHMRYRDGLDAPAIAAALGLSVVTVKRHHARALHLLARGLANTEWADVLRRVLDGTAYGPSERA